MRKFLFICSMLIVSQTFANDSANAENGSKLNELQRLTTKICKSDRKSDCCNPGPTGPRGNQGEKGDQGSNGNRGARGSRGDRCHQGERGQRGSRGLPAGADIIAFSSGSTFFLSQGGEFESQAMLGMGNFIQINNFGTTDNIILDNSSTAFVAPRNGNITSLAASFVISEDIETADVYTIRAELYVATSASNIFVPQGGVDLSPLVTGVITRGSLLQGIVNFSPISVNVSDRILVVFSLTSTGSFANINGTASAGITIE